MGALIVLILLVPAHATAALPNLDTRDRARVAEATRADRDAYRSRLGYQAAVANDPVTGGLKVTGRTGVEMEAMTAVSIACLTVYDMVKSVERGVRIEGVRLIKRHTKKSNNNPDGGILERIGALAVGVRLLERGNDRGLRLGGLLDVALVRHFLA